MKEHRSWEELKSDNLGAAWVVNGEFCPDYTRTSDAGVNTILEQHRESGLLEWQISGFNGCWSCDHMQTCRLYLETANR